MVSKAIRRAIEHCTANDTLTPKSKPSAIETTENPNKASTDDQGGTADAGTGKSAQPHDANNEDTKEEAKRDNSKPADSSPLASLKKALLSSYGSAQSAFQALSNSDDVVGRKEWKRGIKKAGLAEDFGSKDLKALRSSLPKITTLSAFCSFLGESPVQDEVTQDIESSGLAPLPPEVPALPSSFRSRDHAQAQLTAALLESGRRSTSLTAPKSRVSSQG